ncbi:FAD dependent sulfhydryl oxidase Erv1 [Aspergillus egyptiacus]|nr:FAD dependent sulfhydryl oxidase Erv1 [Aspergillus egyptiacus]
MADNHPASQSQSQSQPNTQRTLFPHQSASAASSSRASGSETRNDESVQSKLPGGVKLDKDGKPCRLCTSAAAWRNMTKQAKGASAVTAASSAPKPNQEVAGKPECPPDVEELGRSTWTLLHSMTATYPEKASQEQQSEMRSFLKLFSKLYPCWVCADDFRNWMAEPSGKNQPRLGGRSEFGNWMCEAHNEVNRKLGKKEFDCRFWEERWRTGWKDGRCD